MTVFYVTLCDPLWKGRMAVCRSLFNFLPLFRMLVNVIKGSSSNKWACTHTSTHSSWGKWIQQQLPNSQPSLWWGNNYQHVKAYVYSTILTPCKILINLQLIYLLGSWNQLCQNYSGMNWGQARTKQVSHCQCRVSHTWLHPDLWNRDTLPWSLPSQVPIARAAARSTQTQVH